MKLSIITPYYKTLEQTKKLAEGLIPQLTKDTEWIVIVDGCEYKELCRHFVDLSKIYDNWNITVSILETNSGGASVPRNEGLDIAKGEYIAFIDSDDYVSDNYIDKILTNLKGQDYMFISWTHRLGDIIIRQEPPTWNCCVWNCIYKRELIGNERFDPKLRIAEDYDFNKRVRRGTHNAIQDILYYYQDTPGSLSKGGNDNAI